MKLRFTSIVVLLGALLAAPAFASTVVYTNGPINGNVEAYSFSGLYGWQTADSFVVSSAATVSSFDAGAWVSPGDTPTSVGWEILTGGPDFLGGTVVASGSATPSNVYWGQGFGYYDIYTSTVSGLNVSLGAGTYWLELLNGYTALNSNIFWDVNNGSSQAYQSGTGAVASEAFTIYSGGTSTPEPGTLIMFGSGILGLAGVLRRKINL